MDFGNYYAIILLSLAETQDKWILAKKIESHKTICTILNGSINNRVFAAVWIKFNRHWLCVTERSIFTK